MPRLLTLADLELLARPPRRELADALGGEWQAAEALWREQRQAWIDFLALYRNWVASLEELILERWGRDALADASRLDAVIGAVLARGTTASDLAGGLDDADPVAERLRERDASGALVAFDDVERGVRARHDWLRDWISALLSWIYREHGIDALRAALRRSGELFWMPWMAEEVTRDPARRVRDWVRLLKANFGTIRIEEDDEKFTILQDPCGSCGRQEIEAPAGLAVVAEKDPLTFLRGGVPAYRTHIAMMHFLMPIERIGAPWPTILCPTRPGGVCRILLYKDPKAVVAEHHGLVGLGPGRTT